MTNESSASDPALHEELAPETLDTVQDRLDKLHDPDEPSSDSTSEPSTEIPVEKPEPSEADSKSDETSTDESSTDTPEKEDAVVLPDAYRRAAIHQQWSPEEIDEFFASDPEKALKTFESIHTSTNAISKQLSELGQQVSRPVIKEETPKPEVSQTGIDLSGLEKDYANDPILDVVKKLDAQNQEMRTEVTALKDRPVTNVPATQSAEVTALGQTIDQFFADDKLMPTNEYYGTDKKDWRDLTQNQTTHRQDVLVRADQLVSGAAAQGRELDIAKALSQAHLLETASSIKANVAAEIRTTLTKREKNFGFRPGTALVEKSTDDNSEEGLLARTKKRLGNVFKNN